MGSNRVGWVFFTGRWHHSVASFERPISQYRGDGTLEARFTRDFIHGSLLYTLK